MQPVYADTEKDILKLATLAGQILLESGAETSRVENTIEHICRAGKIENMDSFVTPTGIFICIETSNQKYHTKIKRIRKRSTNLSKIYQVNNISRDFAASKISFTEALTALTQINTQPSRNKLSLVAAAAFTAGFFALLFGGTMWDGIIALLSGAIVQIISNTSVLSQNAPNFLVNLIDGAICAAIAVLFVEVIHIGNLNSIIIGSIMPLVPGLAITTAIRDTIYGDLVSGTARAVEALLVAIAIASGVGITLNIWYLLQGGLNL